MGSAGVRRWAWRVTAGLYAVALLPIALGLLSPGGRELHWLGVALTTLVATLVGPRLHPPVRRGPARLLAAAIGCFVVVAILQVSAVPWPAWLPVAHLLSAAFAAGYVLTALSMAALATARLPQDGLDGRIDALIVMAAMAAVLYDVLLASGSMHVEGPINRTFIGLLPVIHAPVVTAALRLLVAGAQRLVAAWLYLVASVAGLAATLLLAFAGGHASTSLVSASAIPQTALVGWFLCLAGIACASLHPSGQHLTGVATASVARRAVGRVTVLGVALLALPAVMLREAGDTGNGSGAAAVGAMICVALVLWRIARLLRDRERAAAALGRRADLDAALSALSRAALRAPAPEPFLHEVVGWVGSALGGRCWVASGGELVQRGPFTLVASVDGDGTALVVDRLRAGTADEADVQFLRTAADLTGAALRRWAAESQVRHQALHDALTELPNRLLVMDRLGIALARAEREASSVLVLFLDLDGFKDVNDSLGHAAGDELLVSVARRLRHSVRPDDTVGRLAGDEFVVVCHDIDEPSGIVLAERLLGTLQAPYQLRRGEVVVGASIGLAWAEPGQGADALLIAADAAMYRAKGLGRGRVESYDATLEERAAGRARLARELRGAPARGELSLALQPIVALGSAAAADRVVGAEALLRWQHPADGQIPPGEFIPVAEATGLIIPLGRWALHEACRQAASWRAQLPAAVTFRLFANVSAVELADPAFVLRVRRTLEETGADPRDLGLEVTETASIDHLEATRDCLAAVRDLGLAIALDDFGAGYTALPQLRALPVDLLKVDASFVAGLGKGGCEEAIVEAVVGLARQLGVRTLAEGVETPEQLEAARAIGFDLAQGYLLGHPGPAGSVVARLGLLDAVG